MYLSYVHIKTPLLSCSSWGQLPSRRVWFTRPSSLFLLNKKRRILGYFFLLLKKNKHCWVSLLYPSSQHISSRQDEITILDRLTCSYDASYDARQAWQPRQITSVCFLWSPGIIGSLRTPKHWIEALARSPCMGASKASLDLHPALHLWGLEAHQVPCRSSRRESWKQSFQLSLRDWARFEHCTSIQFQNSRITVGNWGSWRNAWKWGKLGGRYVRASVY